MKNSFLWLISLAFLASSLAAVFQHEVHHIDNLKTELMKKDLPKEYAVYKQRQLHGKFSNFKSTSDNLGNNYGYNYFINITVGTPPQSFTAAFDIYLGYMTIPNYKCNCGATNQFDSTKSSTYQSTNYSFTYGLASGFYGQDVVGFGSLGKDQLLIPNALFGQIVSDPVYGDASVMGLGFTAQNPDGLDPPIVTAINSGILDSPVVTLFLRNPRTSPTNNGVITYGALDTVNCDRDVVYEPLTSSNSFEFSIKKASSGLNEFTGEWTASLRNTRYMITGPKTVIGSFAKEVHATYDNVDGVYIVDCNAKFTLNLTIGTTVYTLTEKELVLDYYDNTCTFQFLPSGDDKWILGIPWFRTFCNVLDYGNKRVGFAKIVT